MTIADSARLGTLYSHLLPCGVCVMNCSGVLNGDGKVWFSVCWEDADDDDSEGGVGVSGVL